MIVRLEEEFSLQAVHKSIKTKSIIDNGFNPKWNFKVKVLHNANEFMFYRFKIKDNNRKKKLFISDQMDVLYYPLPNALLYYIVELSSLKI